MSLEFWKNASPRGRRIIIIGIFFLFTILVTVVGILTPMSPQQIADENNDLNKTQQQIQSMDFAHRTAAIFLNNFEICLLMFVPFIGIVIGTIVLFNTGSVLAAQTITLNASHATGFPPILVFALLFIFPFAWLEFISYSIALSESFWLIRRGLQGEWKREIKNLGKLVLITAALLAAGALIEAALI
ncbi:MAG TPA: stage II sporulation protein M [candidate division Zixibacteria bacterium]|nr:stage II sporulation protein M [candidate division Zixibacteria bacterium]